MAKEAKGFDRTKGVLVIVMGLMTAVVFVSFALMRLHNDRLQAELTLSGNTGIHVSLGAMEYDFSTNKDTATRRTDESVKSLRAFLESDAKENIRLGCQSVYYNVMSSNESETQVLLNYGCEYPNARMFAVLENDKWRMISPTNEFDLFGTPLCAHVDENEIDVRLAPICIENFPHEDASQKPEYRIRT